MSFQDLTAEQQQADARDQDHGPDRELQGGNQLDKGDVHGGQPLL